jgi:GNAT superfamily N-acetyltransferase
MPDIKRISNKKQLADYFQRNIYLHIYSLGDLDEFFWPLTEYYGQEHDGKVERVLTLYKGGTSPTLLALGSQEDLSHQDLKKIQPYLPESFEAHLSPDLESTFYPTHKIVSHGAHYKMGLVKRESLFDFTNQTAAQINSDHLDEVQNLYRISYPENWFDPRMLQTGQYFGIWQKDKLVSIAGVHVYSPAYRVAALGNITTHPDFRNRGLGTQITAALCRSLLQTVDVIGLNVKADNHAAISCYKTLGFEVKAGYHEFSLQKKH